MGIARVGSDLNKRKSYTAATTSVIQVALCGLKLTGRRFPIGFQRNLQITVNLRLKLPGLEKQKLEPDPQINLQIDAVNSGIFVFVQFRCLIGTQEHHLLPFKLRAQKISTLMVLIERRQILRVEPNILIQRPGFDAVVVDAEPLVRVSDGDVESEIIMESIAGVVELGEGCVGDMEFDLVGTNDEPEHNTEKGDYDEEGYKDFADTAADAVKEAAATPPNAAAAIAAAVAFGVVVGFRGWD